MREPAVPLHSRRLRDAIFARTNAHFGEERILKAAFAKIDVDGNRKLDVHGERHQASKPRMHTFIYAGHIATHVHT